jgi:hypothetical protein
MFEVVLFEIVLGLKLKNCIGRRKKSIEIKKMLASVPGH